MPTAPVTSLPSPPYGPPMATDPTAGEPARRAAGRSDRAAGDGRVTRLASWNRARLEAEGLLLEPPPRGGPLIGPAHRSPAGEELLREARDLLRALLCDEPPAAAGPHRVTTLTLTLPRDKAHTLAFLLRAATGIGTVGGAANLLFRVEYAEVADHSVGRAVTACLRLVNDLEVNEPELYGRAENAGEDPPA
ncbi:hypothetical protein GCM10010423_47460 [Streptomyces levis]|uniref:Uncharacterized protein n=2 Tax=Streptomyces levis TaxID=285566 RepID=A0ABN3NWF1_9ACTN